MDHPQESGCHVQTIIDLTLTDTSCNVLRELGRQKSDFDSFSGNDIAGTVKKYGDYLKLRDYAYMLCFKIQLSFLVMAVSASLKSVNCEDAKDNEQKRGEQTFCNRSDPCCIWENCRIFIETLGGEISVALALPNMLCTFGKKIWMRGIMFWVWTIVFKSHRMNAFQQIDEWWLRFIFYRLQNLNLSRSPRMVHREGTHLYKQSRNPFCWRCTYITN